jgi:hypothetical protein
MTVSDVFGLLSVVCIVAFAVFAFRQGIKVKPDPERKPGSDGGGGGAWP